MNQSENKIADHYVTCSGCSVGMTEVEIKYTNDEGHDYCSDCNDAIQSDDESIGRLDKSTNIIEIVREAAKAEMGVEYEPHMSQTDQSFIQGAEFGAEFTTASLIQTIENRVKELEEKLKSYCTYEDQYLIIEAQIKENSNLLTLIKS